MHHFKIVGAVAAMSCALFNSACGSSNKPAQSAPAAEEKPWLSTLIDEDHDSQVRIRPQDAEKDPVFGPIIQRAETQAAPMLAMIPVARSGFATFEKSSLVIIATRRADPVDAVIIFEGVPESLSPATMNDPSGAPLFKRVDGTPADVDEYDRNKGDDGSLHSPMALHVATVHQMWVVALGPAVERLHNAVMSDKMEELHADPGPLFSATAVGDLVDTAKKSDHPPQIQPVIDGLSRVDFEVAGGTPTHVKISLTYADENAATTAQNFVQTTMTDVKTQKPELKADLDAMTLGRDKAKVTFDAPLPADFLQAVMQHSPVADAPPPPEPPTPIPAKKKPKKSKH